MKPTRIQPVRGSCGAAGETLAFYLGDCLDVLPHVSSARQLTSSSPRRPTISGFATGRTRTRCRATSTCAGPGGGCGEVAAVLAPDGSLFLNVGAKPKDPWVAMDIAQAVRPHLHLQNTIHWVKSIVIERNAAGAGAGLPRDLAVGHYKPINSPRFLNDCHEFIFHFTPAGDDAARPDRDRGGVPGPVERRRGGSTAAGNRRCRGNAWFLPYETINSREKDRPHPATFPGAAAGVLPAAARDGTRAPGPRSVHRPRLDGGRVRPARTRLRRGRTRSGVSRPGGGAGPARAGLAEPFFGEGGAGAEQRPRSSR